MKCTDLAILMTQSLISGAYFVFSMCDEALNVGLAVLITELLLIFLYNIKKFVTFGHDDKISLDKGGTNYATILKVYSLEYRG